MTTPWTKLQDHEIWNSVKDLYADSRREYHNFDHIEYIYSVAEKLKIEYSTSLDLAILFHDAVYDHLPEKEARSLGLMAMSCLRHFDPLDVGKAAYLIGTTANHSLKVEDPTLVLLDLFSFTDPQEREKNFYLIADENMKLYGIEYRDEELIQKQISFLEDLYVKLSNERSSVRFFLKNLDLLANVDNIIQGIKNNITWARRNNPRNASIYDVLQAFTGSSRPMPAQKILIDAYLNEDTDIYREFLRCSGTTSALLTIAAHARLEGKRVLFLTTNLDATQRHREEVEKALADFDIPEG
ncbi:MAG: hypothetical protein Q4G11_07300, partial [Gallicola sp.]|nr:hypothetical protein [Gallicola sp.]